MSSGASSGGRRPRGDGPAYVPGDVIDGRYRVVSLLGRGGMGEVWRVEDLQLGQEVALKFLPAELAADADARQRFQGEVRVARQVSHPNVCRVHDVGGGEDAPYLTMEYVDGEDLSSLLRRVGRLSGDRAVVLARQVCAGLAAAHDRGIVHRDLKPANVLVDGEGNARIADFGLSALAAEMTADDARVGTPRYMAPEQLRGEEVTPRSDIFALGLVLFELFTGREAFSARTMDELVRAHESSRPDARSVVPELDPTIDALLRRCLAADPARRPTSAREVSAALPGGDPLAAALAAGETPSPELIAASGGVGALRPRAAATLLAAAVALLLLLGWADGRMKLVSIVDPELPAQVLDQRALEIVRAAGLVGADERPEDSFGRFTQRVRGELVDTSAAHGDRWARLAHPWSEALRYWWRGSAARLEPVTPGGLVSWDDPPLTTPGDLRVLVAHDGRLLALSACPRPEDARAASSSPAARCDWAPLFAAAGLDPTTLSSAAADFLVPYDNDEKVAFEGPLPGLDEARVRVEAAALGARPVTFDLSLEWDLPAVASGSWSGLRRDLFQISQELVSLLGIFGGLWFAVANLRRGQGDLGGGVRVALAVIAITSIAWALRAHHTTIYVDGFFKALPRWLFQGSLAGFLYVAIEPTVRRTSPRKLVTWQRLLRGKFGDPAVARDVLVGLTAGLALQAMLAGNWLTVAALGDPSARPHLSADSSFASTRVQLGALAQSLFGGATFALLLPFLYVLALKLLRSPLSASLALVAVGLARMPYSVLSETPWIDLAFRLAQIVLIVLLFHRAGLVALLACFTIVQVLPGTVGATSFDAWYVGAWQLVGFLTLALAAWAAHAATRAPARARSSPAGRS